jgi:hypothetical protein
MQDSTATGPVAFRSWEAFRRSYDAEHRHPVNRAIHHASHAVVLASAGAAVLGHPGLLVAAALGAFPVNWLGHRVFERNQPAFLRAGDTQGAAAAMGRKALVALGGVAWTVACSVESAFRLVRPRPAGV